MNKIGNILVGLSLLFVLIETWYFDWNILPSTSEEIICDAIAVTLFVVGVFIKYLANEQNYTRT